MFLTLRELELRKIEFSESYAPGAIDFGPEIKQVKPLLAKGRAELIREHGGDAIVEDIRIVGDLSTTMESPCSRCVETVRTEVKAEFDLLYRPLETVKESEEVSISSDETEIGYFTGEGMNLEDALKEQVLLSVPVKMVCREDCKGLCPHCGQNRNSAECGCTEKSNDPRWAALAGLREKLKP